MSWPEALAALVDDAVAEAPVRTDRRQYAALTTRWNAEVDVACFLIERGYAPLYEAVSNALATTLYDMPLVAKARLEASFLSWSVAQSDEQFMNDHVQRQRGSSSADRIDEVGRAYPTRSARTSDVAACPKCVVCQQDLRKRQHVRCLGEGCIFHRRCIDEWLLQSRFCPICRARVINDT